MSSSSRTATSYTLPAAVSTETMRFGVSNANSLGILIANTGANQISLITIYGKTGIGVSDAYKFTLTTTPQTVAGFVLNTTFTGSTLAAAGVGLIVLDVGGLSEVILNMTAAAGGSTALVAGTSKP